MSNYLQTEWMRNYCELWIIMERLNHLTIARKNWIAGELHKYIMA